MLVHLSQEPLIAWDLACGFFFMIRSRYYSEYGVRFWLNIYFLIFHIFLYIFRVNGQYIMEGLAASFMFLMGGIGFILFDVSNGSNLTKLNRNLMLGVAFICTVLPFFVARIFMRMKLPGYLSS